MFFSFNRTFTSIELKIKLEIRFWVPVIHRSIGRNSRLEHKSRLKTKGIQLSICEACKCFGVKKQDSNPEKPAIKANVMEPSPPVLREESDSSRCAGNNEPPGTAPRDGTTHKEGKDSIGLTLGKQTGASLSRWVPYSFAYSGSTRHEAQLEDMFVFLSSKRFSRFFVFLRN
ncbi:hypothetical protein DMENIID0001_131530 [Sergentomyia squamirostris]